MRHTLILIIYRNKQTVIARSSADEEFRVMAQGVCELLWIKIILTELRLEPLESMRLYYDNKATINIAHNLVQQLNMWRLTDTLSRKS